MPLLDHFHQPLADDTPWSAFHQNWSTKMVDQLNGHRLTDKYKAQSGRHFGAQLEADVATLERGRTLFDDEPGEGGVATARAVYAPPAPALSTTVDFDDPDVFEVKVFRGSGGWQLVAAVELVSESNKDRDDSRRAFAVKCASYLQKGISLVVVDTVTTYSADLHDELCDLLDDAHGLRWVSPSGLSVVAYRSIRVASADRTALALDVYPHAIALGGALPTVPLWLAPDLAVPLELEHTYQLACQSLRLV